MLYLWPTTVQFSQRYFKSLMKHAVPLNETAVARQSHSAMGLAMAMNASASAESSREVSRKQSLITRRPSSTSTNKASGYVTVGGAVSPGTLSAPTQNPGAGLATHSAAQQSGTAP